MPTIGSTRGGDFRSAGSQPFALALVADFETALSGSSSLLSGPQFLVWAAGLKDLLDRVGPAPLLVPAASAPYDAQVVSPLQVLHFEPSRYRQAFDGFEPGMTALDVLFNYGPEAASIIKEGGRIEAYSAEKR